MSTLRAYIEALSAVVLYCCRVPRAECVVIRGLEREVSTAANDRTVPTMTCPDDVGSRLHGRQGLQEIRKPKRRQQRSNRDLEGMNWLREDGGPQMNP